MLEDDQQQEGDMSRIFHLIYSDEDDDDSICHYGYPEDTELSREVDRLLDILLDM
jgi:hypothetical protein